MKNEKELTIKEILYWIVDHQEDTGAMDKISNTTFTFTSKYKDWKEKN